MAQNFTAKEKHFPFQGKPAARLSSTYKTQVAMRFISER